MWARLEVGNMNNVEKNREKAIVSAVSTIRGWCPMERIPEVVEALQNNRCFFGFTMIDTDDSEEEGVAGDTPEEEVTKEVDSIMHDEDD